MVWHVRVDSETDTLPHLRAYDSLSNYPKRFPHECMDQCFRTESNPQA